MPAGRTNAQELSQSFLRAFAELARSSPRAVPELFRALNCKRLIAKVDFLKNATAIASNLGQMHVRSY